MCVRLHPSDQSPDSGGYADLWNLQTLMIPSLAFAATIVHFLKQHAHSFVSLDFCRHVMPCPLREAVVGHMTGRCEGLVALDFTTKSSKQLESGVKENGLCSSHGGISV